ncbi:MAG: C-GCAxxG-C-C family (seleno)protein [Candidatus Hodarchaeales archaeon]
MKNIDDKILTQAYRRMHRYTCAEASLQALLEMWKLPLSEFSWATGGYLGAITSGDTSCGLLIGSSIALGLNCGKDKEGIPELHEDERNQAIQYVHELYSSFIEKFGSTQCKQISNVDFSNGEEISDYMVHKKWKKTCDIYLDYVIHKCSDMIEQ